MRLNSNALASLRFFEAVARLLSFTRAAAELSVTPGAVSHQIKYLEDSLGCKLFYRLPKQIQLTDEGRELAATAARALQDLDRKAAEVIAASRSESEIRLRAGPSFALRWLVPRLSALRARHPNLSLRVIGAYGYVDPERRNFDLAVEFRQDDLPGLQSEVLMEEYLLPVCSPQYLSEHGFLAAPEDLARCTLLHDGDAWESASEDAEWRHWLDEVGAHDVESRHGQFFTLSNMAIEAALAHQGVALGRASLVRDLLASERLVAPFRGCVKSPCRYSLAYPREIADRPCMRMVMEWLRAEAAKMPESPPARGTSDAQRRSGAGKQPALRRRVAGQMA
jgi:LysR family glycine cleavage system transcriptional activator